MPHCGRPVVETLINPSLVSVINNQAMRTRGGLEWQLPPTEKKKPAKKGQKTKAVIADAIWNEHHTGKRPSKTSNQHAEKDQNAATHVRDGQTETENKCNKIVTAEDKTVWRQCLKDVKTIYIPHATSLRPMKTRNAFVTKTIVLLAYLIVHAEEGKPMPRISGKFKIDPVRDETAAMEDEIIQSGVDYVDPKLKWNMYELPRIHIGACLYIGSWLANQLHKAKQHGTWKVVGPEVIGSTKGLYEPYKDLLEKIGIDVPVKTPVI